jgi:hypothetical protein
MVCTYSTPGEYFSILLVCILGDRYLLGRRWLRSEPVLREFSRVGIQDGVMGVPLLLLHKVDTLCADFYTID